MKLIKWKTLTDTENVYDTKFVTKTDWKGNVIGTEEIRTARVIAKKEYYNEYAQSIDGVWKFEHLSKVKFDQWTINGLATSKEEFNRVMKEVEAA